jgi:hypothetical protein
MERDDPYRPQPLASWFKFGAIGSVLWMMFGCAIYLIDVTTDVASLPADQRTLVEARPAWMVAAYGIAVWIGLAGAVLLAMRRKMAEPLLLISLIGTLVIFAAYFIVPGLRDNMSSDQLLVPIVVVLLGWTIYWFARHSRQRGWLR